MRHHRLGVQRDPHHRPLAGVRVTLIRNQLLGFGIVQVDPAEVVIELLHQPLADVDEHVLAAGGLPADLADAGECFPLGELAHRRRLHGTPVDGESEGGLHRVQAGHLFGAEMARLLAAQHQRAERRHVVGLRQRQHQQGPQIVLNVIRRVGQGFAGILLFLERALHDDAAPTHRPAQQRVRAGDHQATVDGHGIQGAEVGQFEQGAGGRRAEQQQAVVAHHLAHRRLDGVHGGVQIHGRVEPSQQVHRGAAHLAVPLLVLDAGGEVLLFRLGFLQLQDAPDGAGHRLAQRLDEFPLVLQEFPLEEHPGAV